MMDAARPDGVLVVDKPAGPTSHDLVYRVRRLFPKVKVGHLGTLDPFATGVLPLCLGKATRLSQFLSQGEKVYQADVVLGSATDTGDCTGKVLFESAVPPMDAGMLESFLVRFQTTWMQKPPFFSARKMNGVPLYRYARRGIMVEGRAREVTVYEIRLLAIGTSQCQIQLRCSPGTYIRGIADELGKLIGCGAHLQGLRRLESGEFHLTRALDGKILFTAPSSHEILGSLLPMNSLLPHLPRLTVIEEGLHRLKKGLDISKQHCVDPELPCTCPTDNPSGFFRLMTVAGHLVAIGRRIMASETQERRDAPGENVPYIHPQVVLF